MSEAPRILVVDDEESIVEFLEMGLVNNGFEVATALDGRTALQRFDDFAPHAVVLDVMLPDITGVEVCILLRSRSNLPILMLSAKTELDDRVNGLDSGADDYLNKPFKLKELMARLRALLRRSGLGTGNTLTYADMVLDRSSRTFSRQGRPLELTVREFDLMELLMQRPHHVFRRDEILDRLWGHDFNGGTKVVEVYVRSLRAKLRDTQRRIIRNIRSLGYTLGA